MAGVWVVVDCVWQWVSRVLLVGWDCGAVGSSERSGGLPRPGGGGPSGTARAKRKGRGGRPGGDRSDLACLLSVVVRVMWAVVGCGIPVQRSDWDGPGQGWCKTQPDGSPGGSLVEVSGRNVRVS